MEIRKYQDIIGVVAQEDIREGLMVHLCANASAYSYDFGSRTDLPGVSLPATASGAALAKYVAAFAVDNSSTPIYSPTPSMPFALRGGFDQDANVPFAATVYLTHPGNMKGQTIPSGSLCLAFAGGVYTVYSGCFVPSGGLVAGARLDVRDTATDGAGEAGKLEHEPTGVAGIATVIQYDSTNLELTFRTDNP